MKNLIKPELPIMAADVCVVPKFKRRHEDHILKELYQDAFLLISEIKSKYPELYKHLDETPVKLSKNVEIKSKIFEMQNYVETLRNHLCNHFESHELNLK